MPVTFKNEDKIPRGLIAQCPHISVPIPEPTTARQWRHTPLISAFGRQRRVELCKANLDYRESSGTARATLVAVVTHIPTIGSAIGAMRVVGLYCRLLSGEVNINLIAR